MKSVAIRTSNILMVLSLVFLSFPVIAPADTLPFSCSDVTEIPQIECEGLVALYNSTGGDGWRYNTNWLVTNTPSDWRGVEVTDGHITEIVLPGNQLTGSIPSELGSMAALQILHLSDNQLAGSIPPALGSLHALEEVYLFRNQLAGSIPPELGNLTALTFLDLHGNQLAGSIPPELGNLTALTVLSLHWNQLNGSIPTQLGNLTALTKLYLFDNQLGGSIPPELGNLTALTRLGLSRNELTGNIPPELGDLTALTHLNLYLNQLTGSIPPELGDLTALTWLDLTGNQLGGSIPPELGNLTALTVLALRHTELSGSIPPELCNLTALTGLYLDANQLTGSIPPELGNLTALGSLWLGRNQLTGSIPPELGSLPALTNLSLGGNQLTGSIPPELGNLPTLQRLSLSQNQLTGNIPPELGNLTAMNQLSLSGNQFTGNIPPELGNLTAMTTTILIRNDLTGSIPPSFVNLSQLDRFWFYETDLCEPTTPEYLAWKATVADYQGTGVTCEPGTSYTISGHVEYGEGLPIPDVTMTAGAYSAITNASGDYAITGVLTGTYTLTPSRSGYTFSPPTRTVTLPPDATGQDFTGFDGVTDSDGDALLDQWEVEGYDHNGDGVADVDLPAMGANPYIKDIFVEIDYMVEYDQNGAITHTHQPKSEAIDRVVQAFARQGIHLHVDCGPLAELTWGDAPIWGSLSDGEKLAHQEFLNAPHESWNDPTDWPGFDRIMVAQGHFKRERAPIFHYAVFAHFLGGNLPNNYNGLSRNNVGVCDDWRLGASDFVAAFGGAPDGEGSPVQQASVFMHELGHNLGLCHGGDDDVNFKPNYLSIMNYSYNTIGLLRNGEDGYIDYSDFGNETIPPLVETALNEGIGLNGGLSIDDYGTRYYCRPLGIWWNRRVENANGGIDWNCNLVTLGVVEANINDGNRDVVDNALGTLFAFNDWDNLVFDGGRIGISETASTSAHIATGGEGVPEEMTWDMASTFYRPYAISAISTGSGIVFPGQNSTLPITITNTGALTASVTLSSTTTASWFDLASMPIAATLAPSETWTYGASLSIPVTETSGTEQTVTVKAILNESPRMGDTTTLYARIGPMAWFETQPVFGTAPHTVAFSDLSVGDIDSWEWDFGDGFESSEQNPVHIYASPGVYSVVLSVTGADGSDTLTRFNLINVRPGNVFLPVVMR